MPIVQVYIKKLGDIDGPIKSLRGFQRVELEAGKSKNALITLDASSFEFYDWDKRAMAVTAGDYEILYGNSSDAKALKQLVITVK